ncbi:hypothetical protein D9M70_639550 [compost metagenome]
MHLVVVAETIGCAQQRFLDPLVQGAAFFLEQLLEGLLQQGVGTVILDGVTGFLAFDTQVG